MVRDTEKGKEMLKIVADTRRFLTQYGRESLERLQTLNLVLYVNVQHVGRSVCLFQHL